MKITNNLNLPEVFVKMAQNSVYTPKQFSLGATTLLLPAQEIVLRRRFADEMTQDVSDMINLFFGIAVHDMFEKNDDDDFVEMFLKYQIDDDYYVSGKIDKFDKNAMTVVDYKTARVSKITYEDFSDWRKQGLIYAYLLMKNGYYADKIKFIAMLKDWSKFSYLNKRGYDDYYPESPVYVYEQKVHADDLTQIESYIKKKVEQVRTYTELSTSEILETPLEKEFAPIKKFAVYANEDSKRAKRLFANQDEAYTYADDNNYIVKERTEKNHKFEMYCTAMRYAQKIKEV